MMPGNERSLRGAGGPAYRHRVRQGFAGVLRAVDRIKADRLPLQWARTAPSRANESFIGSKPSGGMESSLMPDRCVRVLKVPRRPPVRSRTRGEVSSICRTAIPILRVESQKLPSDQHFCGPEGTRTPDPLHAMQVRYQLRHRPVGFRRSQLLKITPSARGLVNRAGPAHPVPEWPNCDDTRNRGGPPHPRPATPQAARSG